MLNEQQSGDELTYHDNGYDQAKPEQQKISEIFGENVFSLNILKEYVTESTYEEIKGVILNRHFPDNPQFVANSSHTPPPMEEISLCGHPTALI